MKPFLFAVLAISLLRAGWKVYEGNVKTTSDGDGMAWGFSLITDAALAIYATALLWDRT